jgi:hypothetical protein
MLSRGTKGSASARDAKALLAVNFQDMVASPLLLHGVPPGEVGDALTEDIARLARAASTETDELDNAGVSGRAVIDALSRNWSELRISQYRMWDRSDE